MITLTLPYPISANRYWRPVRIGQHITIVPTSEAKQYRRAVARIAAEARISAIAGRVEVHVQLFPHRPLDAQAQSLAAAVTANTPAASPPAAGTAAS